MRLLAHAPDSTWRREAARQGRIGVGPSRLRWTMRTTWNGSLSFGLVSIPVGPRAGDEARCARVGRLLPDAPPRVRDADQAEALLPGARARPRARRDRQGLGGREGPVRVRRGRRPRGDRAARRLALDRDHALRRRSPGRSDLLRPHLLPRPRAGGRGAPAVRAAPERDAGERAWPRSGGSCSRARRSSA